MHFLCIRNNPRRARTLKQQAMENTIIYQITEQSLFSLFTKWQQEREAEKEEKQETKLYTADEVCRMLSIDRSTLWRWGKHRILVGFKVGGLLRYKAEDVEKLIEEERV